MSNMSRHRGKKGKKHRRTQSENITLKRNKFCVPRKLGPIEIGRIKYKGTKTKYADTSANDDFLSEKIHRQARSSSFNKRKKMNPVPKRKTLSDIGQFPNAWRIPSFYKEESLKMQKDQNINFLLDSKPMHVRDNKLDRLKNVRLPKSLYSEKEQNPFSWKPINYELKNDDGNHWLDEKYWYDASQINADYGLSHLLQTLPPEKITRIKKMCTFEAAPTGYESKLNYLNKLRKIVMEEHRKCGTSAALLNVPLTSLHEQNSGGESSDNMSALSEIAESIQNDTDEAIKKALDEILHSPKKVLEQKNENDEESCIHLIDDETMNNALDEILAPSPCPSPQPPPPSSSASSSTMMIIDKSMKAMDLSHEIKSEEDNGDYTDDSLSDLEGINEATDESSQLLSSSRRDLMDKVRVNMNCIQSNIGIDKEEKEQNINKKQTQPMPVVHVPPNEFICPLSKSIITEAVLAADGRIYDKQNMQKWLEENDISPITKKKLRNKQLMPFDELTERIRTWKIKKSAKKRRRRKKRVSNKKKNAISISIEVTDSSDTF